MMQVRVATQADLPAITAIYNEAVQNTTATYDCEPQTLEARQRWFDDHLTSNHPIHLALNGDGRVTGWAALSRFRERPGYRFTVEDSIYVAADQRGRGIGTLLLPTLITAARERGFHAMIGAIDADNKVSLRLHARFGFEQVAHLRQVGFKFGRWLDIIYVELLLESAKQGRDPS